MGALPKTLEQAIHAALEAVHPQACVRRVMGRRESVLTIDGNQYPLDDYRRILLLGLGKAALPMVVAAKDILGDCPTEALVLTKYGHGKGAGSLEVFEAGHPTPDQAGWDATAKIVSTVKSFGQEDFVLCLVSGGCSALLTLPADGLTLEDLSVTTELLLKSGADIVALNTVRKHLSQIKGGQLARLAHPTRVVSLVLSDVIGDSFSVIGSGPTAPDSSTFEDARLVIERFGLDAKLPRAVKAHLKAGVLGQIEDTPNASSPIFGLVTNCLCGNNAMAAEAAAGALEAAGFETDLDLVPFVGEAREVGRYLAALVKKCARPSCFVQGGETTVTVQGEGKGGRATELALAAAIELDGVRDVHLVSFGTDGTDGPTDAAGAYVTGGTAERARNLGLDSEQYLKNNASYSFFERLDDLIITGPTQTNVADLVIVQVGRPSEEPHEA